MNNKITPLNYTPEDEESFSHSENALVIAQSSPKDKPQEEDLSSQYSGSSISSSALPKSINPLKLTGEESFLRKGRKNFLVECCSRLTSVQIVLPTFVVAQIILTIVVISAIQIGMSIHSVYSVSGHLQKKINDMVESTTTDILGKPLHALSAVIVGEKIGGWNSSDEASMRRMLWNEYQVVAQDNVASALGIATSENMYIVYSLGPNGEFSMSGSHWSTFFESGGSGKNPRGLWKVSCDQETGEPIMASSSMIINATYTASTKQQYTGAIKSAPTWHFTPVFQTAGGFPATFVSQAVNTDSSRGPLSAVFIAMELELLNEKLSEIFVSPNGYTFIVEPNGMLVATGLSNPDSGQIVRHMVNESEIEPIKITSIALLEQYGSLENVKEKLIQMGSDESSADDDSSDVEKKSVIMTTYTTGLLSNWVQISRFTHGTTIDWLIIVVTPEYDFMTQLYISLGVTIGITLIVLVIATAVAVCLSITITRPLRKLERQMESVAKMRLSSRSLFKRKKVTLHEVRGIQDSFRRMVYALINFRKFVPDTVISLAMDQEGVLQAKLDIFEDVTISFLDIENFTSLSEQLSLDSLITVITEAMEVCSAIVTEEGACIDKYIGDCIMALFNVPLPVERHHHKACNTALRCILSLKKLHRNWAERGLPQLKCRIGIHSGECLVGNFGSTNRLNYTAVGDTVNTAARLEPLNKDYQTRILISKTIYDQVKDEFCCRCVDIVRVKGKSNAVTVYELVNYRRKATPANVRVENYMEMWLNSGQENDIGAAKEALEMGLKESGYSNDFVMKLLLARIERSMEQPELLLSPFEREDGHGRI